MQFAIQLLPACPIPQPIQTIFNNNYELFDRIHRAGYESFLIERHKPVAGTLEKMVFELKIKKAIAQQEHEYNHLKKENDPPFSPPEEMKTIGWTESIQRIFTACFNILFPLDYDERKKTQLTLLSDLAAEFGKTMSFNSPGNYQISYQQSSTAPSDIEGKNLMRSLMYDTISITYTTKNR